MENTVELDDYLLPNHDTITIPFGGRVYVDIKEGSNLDKKTLNIEFPNAKHVIFRKGSSVWSAEFLPGCVVRPNILRQIDSLNKESKNPIKINTCGHANHITTLGPGKFTLFLRANDYDSSSIYPFNVNLNDGTELDVRELSRRRYNPSKTTVRLHKVGENAKIILRTSGHKNLQIGDDPQKKERKIQILLEVGSTPIFRDILYEFFPNAPELILQNALTTCSPTEIVIESRSGIALPAETVQLLGFNRQASEFVSVSVPHSKGTFRIDDENIHVLDPASQRYLPKTQKVQAILECKQAALVGDACPFLQMYSINLPLIIDVINSLHAKIPIWNKLRDELNENLKSISYIVRKRLDSYNKQASPEDYKKIHDVILDIELGERKPIIESLIFLGKGIVEEINIACKDIEKELEEADREIETIGLDPASLEKHRKIKSFLESNGHYAYSDPQKDIEALTQDLRYPDPPKLSSSPPRNQTIPSDKAEEIIALFDEQARNSRL